MPAVSTATVDLQEQGRSRPVRLRISLLPSAKTELRDALFLVDSLDSEALAAIQIVEGQEYLYEWEADEPFLHPLEVDPQEVFQPDSGDGRRGRLRPGLSTGLLSVQLRQGAQTLGGLALEVRSQKLNYLDEYRWMLRDIADQMTELIMERFAATTLAFSPSPTNDAVTLYQRFAFLRSLLTGARFEGALQELRRRPHVGWEEVEEEVVPGQPVRAGSQVVRDLCRAGKRVAWPDGIILSIPARLQRRRTEATFDTTPNRFVRFALTRWRQILADIDDALRGAPDSAPIKRGRREVGDVLGDVDEVLNDDLFKEVGELAHFPADNPVLQHREGYRDLFRAYVEFELAAQLSWRGAESTYSAGQRDVATLYEYWVFLQLAELVAELAGGKFDLRPLVRREGNGFNVVLQAGRETIVSGEAERLGRKLRLDLYFNRTFLPSGDAAGSWTRPMRPDCSLVIAAAEGEQSGFEPIVLHFDAKYRVDFKDELFGVGDAPVDQDASDLQEGKQGVRSALRDDLLKMHAYRDAIRRSAGAYVLYPGDEKSDPTPYREYHELLPGLGAFALRPVSSGAALGRGALQRFLNDVLEHVAQRLTQHERGRYWLGEVYSAFGQPARTVDWAMHEPPSETRVLLGYVKNAAHWEWIRRTKSYNVRAEGRTGGVSASSRLLYCQLLLLYCPELGLVEMGRVVAGPELVSKLAMEKSAYPEPRGDYWCVQVAWMPRPASLQSISAAALQKLAELRVSLEGEPTGLSWGELVRAADREHGDQEVLQPLREKSKDEISIEDLWECEDPEEWSRALERYWNYVQPKHIDLERALDILDLERVKAFSPQAWYRFLLDEYFRWKYTAPNRYASTTLHLRKYSENGELGELNKVREQLLQIDPQDIKTALEVACEIRGLGIAGGSGLLALMYPAHFGTVDQFVVKALRCVRGLPEKKSIEEMNPESLDPRDGVLLINVMRRKAEQLNRDFGTAEWTPRRIDKILWTYGR